MKSKLNVVLICADQQRADGLGCYGDETAKTPNLDELAAQGSKHERHFAANPVCMPSRASLITGRLPCAHGGLDNGTHLPESEATLPGLLRDAGYRTASAGKLHFQTSENEDGHSSLESRQRWESGCLDAWDGPYYGFERVDLVVGHGERATGHYGRWRAQRFPGFKPGEGANGEGACLSLSAFKSTMPPEAHHNTWVAERAAERLEAFAEEGEPFFLFVSFPDPHHPFTPCAPYHSLFDDTEFPSPAGELGDNRNRPQPYREAAAGRPFAGSGDAAHFPELNGEGYQLVRRYTNAMAAHIDEGVGKVLRTLDRLGLRENTLVLYTSDHGDFLGDYGLLYKGPMASRSLLRVPLIMSGPDVARGTVQSVSSNIDVLPEILHRLEIPLPQGLQGAPLPRPDAEDFDRAALEVGSYRSRPEFLHYTRQTIDERLTWYPLLGEGELYDLAEDPEERSNLFGKSARRGWRDSLLKRLERDFASAANRAVRYRGKY